MMNSLIIDFGEAFVSMMAFTVSHFLMSAGNFRAPLVARLGKRGFFIFYSAVSLGLFVWALSAYLRAPYLELWPLTAAAGVLGIVTMPFATVFLVCGYSAPNPISLVGHKHMFRPPVGIIKVTRAPVMWAATIWALVHTVANGDVASIIFFGLFAVVSLGGAWHLEMRKREQYGEDYHQLAAVTSFVPFVAMVQGRAWVSLDEIGWWRIVAGFVLYCLLLVGHGWLIGPDLLANL